MKDQPTSQTAAASRQARGWFEARNVRDGGDGMKPTFDEIVTGPVDCVHIEQLSDQTFWMAIEKGGERLIVIFGSKNGRSHVTGRFEVE